VIRAFVVAPTAALRLALRARLDGPGITVIGDGATADGAPSDVDVIVLGDVERLAASMGTSPATGPRALVMLADDAPPAATLRQLPLRGWAIVARDASPAELRAATTAAAQGLAVLPAALAARLLPARLPSSNSSRDEEPEPLTLREREVLDLVSHGLSNRQIAERLAISEHTVKFHVASICGKLGAASRTDAVSRGVRRGLVTL
jgi:DNA-binding NarL/FixJ family response regulator